MEQQQEAWEKPEEPVASSFDQELLKDLTAAARAILTTDKYKHLVTAAVIIPIYADAVDADKVLPGGIASVPPTFSAPNDVLRTLPALTDFTRKFMAQHYTTLANAAAGLVENKNAALQELEKVRAEVGETQEKLVAALEVAEAASASARVAEEAADAMKADTEERVAGIVAEHRQQIQELEQQLEEAKKSGKRFKPNNRARKSGKDDESE